MRDKENGGVFLAYVGEGGSGAWRNNFSDGDLTFFLKRYNKVLLQAGYAL